MYSSLNSKTNFVNIIYILIFANPQSLQAKSDLGNIKKKFDVFVAFVSYSPQRIAGKCCFRVIFLVIYQLNFKKILEMHQDESTKQMFFFSIIIIMQGHKT